MSQNLQIKSIKLSAISNPKSRSHFPEKIKTSPRSTLFKMSVRPLIGKISEIPTMELQPKCMARMRFLL